MVQPNPNHPTPPRPGRQSPAIDTADLDALGVELDAVAPSADALIQAAEALVDLLKAKERMAKAGGQPAFGGVVFPDAAALYAEILRYAGMPAGATPEVLDALDAYWAARAERVLSAARAASATAQADSTRSP